ncbi:MAG: excinuclease ABC subunit UvrC [Myxococcales bacterium]|nr:excinuclease ABC subunit UvrC [Myxococcales bacterium]
MARARERRSTPGKRRAGATAATAVPAGWEPRARSREEVLGLVERLPDQPGVYIMRDRKGAIVYVGKAHRLRARVRQYFSGHDTRHFVPLLGELLGDIETVVTQNDKEALLLENTLIKEHRPRFNVKLRDDKQYLVLRLDPRARWPRLELVRRVQSDGAHYFGPYHSAVSVRHALRVVNRHFQLRTCTDYVLDHRSRPCLQHQIGRCPAPCVYEVDAAAYGEQVHGVALFLDGRHRELVTALRARMEAAAEALEFEVAARIRDQIESIETSLEAQRVVGSGERDQDVIGMYREGGQVEFVVMHVRQGKLLGTRAHSQRGMELPDPEVLHSFLAAYYADAPMIPDEVLLPSALADDDAEPLAAWLREESGRKVALLVPERGDRRRLVDLARRNAASNFVTRRDRQEDAERVLETLQSRFGLSRLPRVIECYDISHIQGSDTVASMVVFVDGVPAKERYRSFKIRGLGEGLAQGTRQNDDFSSMAEVLGRRLRRGLEAAGAAEAAEEDEVVGEAEAADEVSGETGDSEASAGEAEVAADAGGTGDAADAADERDVDDAWALPDLLVIDGGKGQLARVLAAMQDMGVPLGAEGVDVIALAKERRLDLGHGRKALDRLRDHAAERGEPGGGAADADAAAGEGSSAPLLRPGQALQDFVVSTADEDDAVIDDADDAGDEGEGSSGGGDGDDRGLKPERVFVPGAKEAIRLRAGSSELFLLARIRDEAHRFAITHHRRRRGKRALTSSLDGIEGIGPATKKALLRHFGSLAAIRRADVEALKAVKGVGPRLAARIRELLGEG